MGIIGKRATGGRGMLVEFVGERSVLRDVRTGGPCSIEPGGIYLIEPLRDDGLLWVSITAQDGSRCACPYSSLDSLLANWRRVHA